MKKFLSLFVLIVFALTVSAQQYKQTFSTDTVKGDTTYYPSSSSDPNTLRPTTGVTSKISTGVISFTFTHADVADSLAAARLEWSNDGTTWTALTGNAALSATTTDGTSTVYTSTPLIGLYYRAFLSCATGDTVAITSPTMIYKEK